MTFRILSCDGGGIRGLITALLIQNLDDSFGIVKKTDGFAGTSTGGLIVLALANGISVEKIVDIYQSEGANIFVPNDGLRAKNSKRPVARRQANLRIFASGPGIFECQYKSTGLSAIAEALFKRQCLRDAKQYVAVNTAQLWDKYSWKGVTFSNSGQNEYRSVLMKDAALATSAAPTYFPPHKLGSLGYFADGGTFANNPSMSAIADAMAGGYVNSVADFRVLSLGTGYVRQGIPPKDIGDPLAWGAIRWMWPFSYSTVPSMPLLELLMAATSQAVTTEATNLLGRNFGRGDVLLKQAVGLDDWKKVKVLRRLTEAYLGSTEWQKMRGWVANHWLT